MFFVIDTDGVLHHRDTTPSLDLVNQEVGPEGWAHVWLNPGWWLHGWVNDCGLVLPERYPRNVIGSCVLAALGGNQQPYAGPVVITGYDHTCDWGGPEPLNQEQAAVVVEQHSLVEAALAGRDIGLCACGCGQDRATELRAFAEEVRSGDTPPITLLSGDEALDFLNRGGPR